jgi:hypothetical protein
MMEVTEMMETIDETIGPIPFSEGTHVHEWITHAHVSTPKPRAPKPDITPSTPEAKRLAVALAWFLLFIIVGTLLGVWIKFFWMGWVFLP